MFTQAPEITIDATIGEIVTQPTVTATPTSTSTSSTTQPTATSTPTPVYTYAPTPKPITPTIPPIKRYKENALVIYGYGPRNAEVTLKGFGVSEKTTTEDNGFFVFGGIYSLTSKYPELCVQAIDDQKRSTQPSCIPALPNDSLIPLEVGPILLSPTISISENNVKEGSYSYLSGKTIPNSNVNVFISKRESNLSKISLVNEAFAYTLPSLSIIADEKGEYSVTLPTEEATKYTIFTSSKFGEDLTNKSTSLDFIVLTKLKTVLDNILDLILQNKILAFVLVEVVVFMILFLKALKSTTRPVNKHSEKDYLEFLKLS